MANNRRLRKTEMLIARFLCSQPPQKWIMNIWDVYPSEYERLLAVKVHIHKIERQPHSHTVQKPPKAKVKFENRNRCQNGTGK